MNIITSTHNKKNTTIAPVAPVVELGKATILTLGVGTKKTENNQQPFGCWKNTN